jgi:hypothetical protein
MSLFRKTGSHFCGTCSSRIEFANCAFAPQPRAPLIALEPRELLDGGGVTRSRGEKQTKARASDPREVELRLCDARCELASVRIIRIVSIAEKCARQISEFAARVIADRERQAMAKSIAGASSLSCPGSGTGAAQRVLRGALLSLRRPGPGAVATIERNALSSRSRARPGARARIGAIGGEPPGAGHHAGLTAGASGAVTFAASGGGAARASRNR